MFPYYCSRIGFIYFGARILNRIYYPTNKGIVHPLRTLSAILNFISIFVAFGFAVHSSYLVAKAI